MDWYTGLLNSNHIKRQILIQSLPNSYTAIELTDKQTLQLTKLNWIYFN